MSDPKLYLLFEEAGAYSSYFMGNIGLFSTLEKAKAHVEEKCREAVASHPSNKDFAYRTEWQIDEFGDWVCEIPTASFGDNHSWTIQPIEVDALMPAEAAAHV